MHLNPKVGSYWASVYRNVKSIEKTGPMEVTVTLTQPDSMFNQYMAVTPGTIESKAFLEKAGADYGNPSTGVDCTGPFEFDTWKSGQSITLKRYDDYWDPRCKAKAAQVKFVFHAGPQHPGQRLAGRRGRRRLDRPVQRATRSCRTAARAPSTSG